MSNYKQNVDKVYSKLTNRQLLKQVAKFWGSTIQHEQGKLSRALKELRGRKKYEG